MNNDTEKKPVNQGRRRLAQGGLAGSVVLASLISKHALASVVPYNCTKSGKFSGTNSTYGPPSATECDLGNSANDWITSLKNDQDARTFFAIFGVPEDKQTATLLQILEGDVILNSENLLAQQAIVLYLNAELYGNSLSAYPLTRDDVIKMFGCVYKPNGDCGIDTMALGITPWTADDIKTYFALLYH